jgi:hypothetical protein
VSCSRIVAVGDEGDDRGARPVAASGVFVLPRKEAEMNTVGFILAVVGGLMVLSSIRLGLTTYDLHSSHDLSKFCGGLGVSVLILLGGIVLMKKSKLRN